MSSKGWRIQQETVLPGRKSEALEAKPTTVRVKAIWIVEEGKEFPRELNHIERR